VLVNILKNLAKNKIKDSMCEKCEPEDISKINFSIF